MIACALRVPPRLSPRAHSRPPAPRTLARPLPLTLARRPFSSSHQQPAEPLADPTRPDLFYHLLPPPSPLSPTLHAYALTFLPAPPPAPDSPTILGWLPAEGHGEEAGLNDFKENPDFIDILHAAVRRGLEEDVDEIWRNGAAQLQAGWMHIHDDRTVPPLGRIGDPDDILGTVRVDEGKILPSTYSPNPAYRLCTPDGVTQLSPGLFATLKDLLADRVRVRG